MGDTEIYDAIGEEVNPLRERIDDLEEIVLHLCQRVVFSNKPLTLKQYLKGWNLERDRILREREALRANNQVQLAGSHPLQFKGDPEFMVDCEDAQSEYYYWDKDVDWDRE